MHRLLGKLMHYHATVGLKGTICFCLAKIRGTKPVFATNVPGILHPVFVRLATTDVSVMKQVLIEKHYEFQLKHIPNTIIDAGANIGLSAIYFANRFPQAKIVAVEPESSNFALLQRNVSCYPNITPLNAAIWRSDGLINLVDPGLGNHGFQTIAESNGGQATGNAVHAISIETIMHNTGWKTVDLLKVDIEGSERELFAYSTPWIGSIQNIMVELHDELRTGCTESFMKATKAFKSGGRCGESFMVHRNE